MWYYVRREMCNKTLSLIYIDFLQMIERSGIIDDIIIMITIQLLNLVERSIGRHEMNAVEGSYAGIWVTRWVRRRGDQGSR